jgi:hypothetical protein
MYLTKRKNRRFLSQSAFKRQVSQLAFLLVIAYTSKHLEKSQANWSTEEKELFTIIHVALAFYPNVYGRKFQIRSDSQAMPWLNQRKKPTGRIAR